MESYKNTGTHLNRLLSQFTGNLYNKLARAGYPEIRPSHGWLFQFISPDGSRVTELAQYAGITKQSMSVLVYQVEEWGYLSREPDPTDKRGILFKLTDKGMLLQQTGHKINFDFETLWEKKLGTPNYRKFREFVDKLSSTD